MVRIPESCEIYSTRIKVNANIQNAFPTCIFGGANWKASSKNREASSKEAEGF